MLKHEMGGKPQRNYRSHAQALWALGWRMLVLAPVVTVLGALALILVLALTFLPPAAAFVLGLQGDYVWAAATVAGWLLWLRFGGRLRHWVFEGFEHASL